MSEERQTEAYLQKIHFHSKINCVSVLQTKLTGVVCLEDSGLEKSQRFSFIISVLTVVYLLLYE